MPRSRDFVQEILSACSSTIPRLRRKITSSFLFFFRCTFSVRREPRNNAFDRAFIYFSYYLINNFVRGKYIAAPAITNVIKFAPGWSELYDNADLELPLPPSTTVKKVKVTSRIEVLLWFDLVQLMFFNFLLTMSCCAICC